MQKKMILLSAMALILVGASFVLNHRSLADDEKVSKGFLGVVVRDLSSALKSQLNLESGVVVTGVEEDSPAEDAGIQEDDIITDLDTQKIKGTSSLSRLIRKMKPGTEVKIHLYRNGQKNVINVKIGNMPKTRDCYAGNFQRPLVHFKRGAYVGIHMQELNEDLAPYFGIKSKEGVLILNVVKNSPAGEAGIKAGDVLTKIGDEKVSAIDDVMEILSDHEKGDELSFEVVRQKSSKSFKVILKEKDTEDVEIFDTGKMLPRLEDLEIELNDRIKKMDDGLKKKNIRIFRESDNSI